MHENFAKSEVVVYDKLRDINDKDPLSSVFVSEYKSSIQFFFPDESVYFLCKHQCICSQINVYKVTEKIEFIENLTLQE